MLHMITQKHLTQGFDWIKSDNKVDDLRNMPWKMFNKLQNNYNISEWR